MKMDIELIRKILLAAESGNTNGSIDGHSNDILKRHRMLAIEKGLLDGVVLNPHKSEIPPDVQVNKLTFDGHQFLNDIRNETRWNKLKRIIADTGQQVSIEYIKQVLSNMSWWS